MRLRLTLYSTQSCPTKKIILQTLLCCANSIQSFERIDGKMILMFLFDEINYTKYDSGRIYLWMTTISYNLNTIYDWVFGVGFGNAVPFFEIMGYAKEDAGQYFHIDGYFVELLIQQGLLGVLLFLIVITKFILINKYVLISWALIVSLLFYGFFESIIINIASPFGYVPWLIVACIPRFHYQKIIGQNYKLFKMK